MQLPKYTCGSRQSQDTGLEKIKNNKGLLKAISLLVVRDRSQLIIDVGSEGCA